MQSSRPMIVPVYVVTEAPNPVDSKMLERVRYATRAYTRDTVHGINVDVAET